MKNITSFLIKKYKEISGEEKIKIAFSLSNMVKKIKKEGEIASKNYHGGRSS